MKEINKEKELIVTNWFEFAAAVITEQEEFTVVDPGMVKVLMELNKLFKR